MGSGLEVISPDAGANDELVGFVSRLVTGEEFECRVLECIGLSQTNMEQTVADESLENLIQKVSCFEGGCSTIRKSIAHCI